MMASRSAPRTRSRCTCSLKGACAWLRPPPTTPPPPPPPPLLRDGAIMLAPCPRPGRPDEESVEKGQALVEAVLNPCARAAETVVWRAWRGRCPSAGCSIAHSAGQEPLVPAALCPPPPPPHPTPTRTCRYSDNAITQKEMQMRELATVRASEGGGNTCHRLHRSLRRAAASLADQRHTQGGRQGC
jgi:hypothetical protein